MIYLSPPRINPAGFLAQFSSPDSLNATKGQKQNYRSVACLFACQFTTSNQSSLFFYPFAAPPSFLFPSPLLLSCCCYRNRCCWCCPHCTRSPRCCCCCCCCVQYLCLRQLMVLLGYEQPWCVTLFCAPAAPATHLLAAGMLSAGILQIAGMLWASRSSLAATKNVI